MKNGIDTIIHDKNEFHTIIISIPDINEEKYAKEVAHKIASKYKKLALKYHPDKFGLKKFDNVPYVSQMWFLLTDSNELLSNFKTNFKSYDKKIHEYRSSKNFWDDEENKKNLGSIQERIKRIRDEEKNEDEAEENMRKQKSLKRKEEEKEKERIRREKSLKRKEEENERIRKELSLKKKEEENERIRKEISLKKKEEEGRKERQDSIERKIQRRMQFAEDDKKIKKEREEEKERIRKEISLKKKEEEEERKERQDSIEQKIQRRKQFAEDDKKIKKEKEEEEQRRKTLKRKNDEEEERIRQDSSKRKYDEEEERIRQDSLKRKNDENESTGRQEMDIDEQHSLSRKNSRRNGDNYTNNKTRRQRNIRKERINDFMNKTLKRRELINKFRNRNSTEKMDVVNQMLPKIRGRIQKKKSVIDRINDFL